MTGKMGYFGIISYLQKYYHILVNLSNDWYYCINNSVIVSKAEHLKVNIILMMKDWEIHMEK